MSSDGSDAPKDAPDGAGDDAPAGADGAGGEAGERKRRRRRRGGGGGGVDAASPPAEGQSAGGQPAPPRESTQPRPPRQPQQPRDPQQRPPQGPRPPQGQRQPQQPRPPQGQGQPQGQRQPQQQGQQGQRQPQQQGQRPPQQQAHQRGQGQAQGRREDRGPRDRGGRREGRDDQRGLPRSGHEGRDQVGAEGDLRDDDDLLRSDPYRGGGDDDAPRTREPSKAVPLASDSAAHHEDEPATAPVVSWGSDDDSAAPAIVLAPDMPVDAPADDYDPLTYPLVSGPGAQLGDDVASVVGVRFVVAGRIQWCEAGDGDYAIGDRVMVDSERGPRLAVIAAPPARRATRDRGLRRVIRRATEQDLRGEQSGDADRTAALRIAKDKAVALRLPLKVFRVEKAGGKLNVYYTTDERLDLRDFVRDVGQATGLRLELRQLGVRDEAKAVGGIGSCGLTLCCTTWLPDFVPVSIKMAKDQGLVLSPTKVSGQCGRLKCCLVYEQAGYAEMRKGLPKLGKRVVSARGEGRVVEVDVLRQRVRVSYGHGDTEVLPAADVKPMFPPGNQPRAHEHDDHEPEADEPDLPQS